jgi:hypothetical protein
MPNFVSKLEKALSSYEECFAEGFDEVDLMEAVEVPNEPVVVDMSNMEQRKAALNTCRGPHIGWDEYKAGADYQPPYFFQSGVDIPVGPPDEGVNPFAKKYGGVRPWSRSEITETLVGPGGLVYGMIARDTFLSMYTKNMRDDLAVNSLLNLAAEAVEKKIYQDQARTDVRFTTWFFRWLKTSMRRGISAGYRNEYRDARGLLNHWNRILGSAIRVAQTEGDLSQHIDLLMQGGATAGRSGPVDRIGLAEIDPTPGPKNAFGDLADRIHATGKVIESALMTTDPGQIRNARQELVDLKNQFAEEENTNRSRGAHFDTMINPETRVTSLTVKGSDDKDIERSDVVKQDDTGDRERRTDTMHRLISMSRKGLFVDFMQTIGLVDEIWEIIRSGRSKLADEGGRMELARDVKSIRDQVGQQYGHYGDDLGEYLDDIIGGVVQNDEATIVSALQRLTGIKKMAEEESEHAGAGKKGAAARAHTKHTIRPLTDTEYRVLLRFLGMENYPERGTADDPESIEGEPTSWAANGFPRMAKFEIARDPNMWGKPEGVSKVRASQVFKKAMDKVRALSQAAFGETGVQLEGIGHSPLLLEQCQVAIATCLMEFFSEREAVILG